MSDTTYIGRKMRSLRSAPQFDGFSRVVITVSDELEYAAGNNTGRTLHLTCPWGTKQMAKDILADIRGFQYQPYAAEGAFLDPAAELGDTVTAGNIHSGIYTQKLKFGPLLAADIGAPEDEEIDHEYPYTPKQDRIITRSIRNLTTELRVQDGRITAEVSARESAVKELRATLDIQAERISAEVTARQKNVKELRATLDIQAEQISAEVTARKSDVASLSSSIKLNATNITAKVSKTGGNASSFGWELNDSSWVIKANGTDVLKATKNGLEVYGKILAASGKIGGFDIKSNFLCYNNQAWGGTNTTGIYIGVSGIQLGKNFKVDNAGNLTATSGRFSGTVYAGNIQYGDDVGYLSGGGIAGGSIYGDRLVDGTITTTYTSSGINGSLGRADAAYNIATGYTKFSTLVGATLSADDIKLGKDSLTLGTTQITYKDGSDKTKTLNVVTWS